MRSWESWSPRLEAPVQQRAHVDLTKPLCSSLCCLHAPVQRRHLQGPLASTHVAPPIGKTWELQFTAQMVEDCLFQCGKIQGDCT